MRRTVLAGLNGANPLGFMATVGLLRLLDGQKPSGARVGFADDGTFRAWIECDLGLDIAGVIAGDAAGSVGPQPWRLEYDKAEKKGTKVVADLKPPPARFAKFLTAALSEWLSGRPEGADFATAYATDVAVDGKGNTKPTAFHFTAANQQFLGTVETSRSAVTRELAECSLFEPGVTQPGPNLRWDPDAERNRALMGTNPGNSDTVVNAPLEWLAFRGLPAFPCFPEGSRIVTTGVLGRRQDEFRFQWPLWSCGASYAAVRSLIVVVAGWSRAPETESAMRERRRRGVFALCTSDIRRTNQGFGSFAPTVVHV